MSDGDTQDPPTVATPDPTAVTESGSIRALNNLRDSIKWLMAAGAAVVAVLVAGLQVSDFANLASEGAIRQALAAGSAAAALLLVLLTVARCAKLLTTPRRTIRDLAGREKKAGGLAKTPRVKPLPDTLVQTILERRTHLLHGRETISQLYADYLTDGDDSEVGQVQPDSLRSPGRRELEKRIEELEDWAQLFEAESGFRSLTRNFFWGSIAFAVAVLTFAAATADDDRSIEIAEPLRVTAFLNVPPSELGLDPSCNRSTLSGVAVGGTFETPVILLRDIANCGPALISPTRGDVIITPLDD